MRCPRGVAMLAALLEHLHDDGGRGQHEAHAGDERDGAAESPTATPTPVSSSAARRRPAVTPRPKISLPQAPQPRRLHLQADDEQEHHDAELGDCRIAAGSCDQAQPERADREPGREVAQHRAEAQPPEDRHGDDARGEQPNHLHQIDGMLYRFARHAASGRSE